MQTNTNHKNMGVAILKKTGFSTFRDVTGDDEGYYKGKRADQTLRLEVELDSSADHDGEDNDPPSCH